MQLKYFLLTLALCGCASTSNKQVEDLLQQAVELEFHQRKYTQALSVYEELCNKHNHYKSCGQAGYFLSGMPPSKVPSNPQKARQYFEKGCNGNHGFSCSLLGYQYRFVIKNHHKAMNYYKKACHSHQMGYKDWCDSYKKLSDSLNNQ